MRISSEAKRIVAEVCRLDQESAEYVASLIAESNPTSNAEELNSIIEEQLLRFANLKTYDFV